MKSGSLYIADFQESVTAFDLETLIRKFLSVTSTYIPGPTPTGLVRRFALLRVEAKDDTAITDCARKLNNCQWKGCRLRVEIARPFFADKLAGEREQSQIIVPSLGADVSIFNPSENNGVLRIRRYYGHHEFISTMYNGVTVVKRGETAFSVRQLGKRLTFDYDSDDLLIESLKSGLESCESMSGSVSSFVDASMKHVSIEKSSQSLGRRGFGTLLETRKKRLDSQAEEIVEDSFINFIDHKLSESAAVHGEFASGQLEHDIVLQNSKDNKSDIESDDDVHIPSCAAEDLDPETLHHERKRALMLFASLVDKGQPPTELLLKSAPARLNKRGWEAVSETAALRFDPTADDNGTCLLMDAEQKQAFLNKVRMRDEERNKQDGVSTSLEAVSIETSHADLGELKDIFSRKAGVWFGDDGDLNESVRKGGGDVLDDIFLAAEKRGLDIRTTESAANQLTFDFFGENKSAVTLKAEALDERSAVSSGSDTDISLTKRYSVVDLESVFMEAKRFCRASETTEEQIQVAWRATREKGALDYKRRVHDLKRRNKRLGLAQVGNSKPVIQVQNQLTTYNKAAFKKRGGRRGQGGKSK
jgi:hypothetical protein